MTAKKKSTEKIDLKDEINRLMTPDAAKELAGLSLTFQQFLIRWTDLRDDAMREEIMANVQEALLKDNIEFCQNVTDVVVEKVSEVLKPWHIILQNLEGGQKNIAKDIGLIKTDIIDIKKRLKSDEDAILLLGRRISRLERYASIGWTILRSLITAVIAIGISIIAFLEIHALLK